MWQIIVRVANSLTLRLIGAISWVIFLLISSFIAQNYENWAEDRGIADIIDNGVPPSVWQHVMLALSWLAERAVAIAALIASPFGVGFGLAAVIFSIPDIMTVIRRMRERRLAKEAERTLVNSQERIAAERDTIEMLRQFMLNYVQVLRDDLDAVNKIALKETGESYPHLRPVFMLAYSSIIDAEEQKFHRFAKYFAYDRHDVTLSTLQSVLCNYLMEYEKLVRYSHELIRLSANQIATSDAYRRWKNNDTQCLLRFRKLTEHHLLSDLALFLHSKSFRMGQEYYISQSLESDLDAAAAHRA